MTVSAAWIHRSWDAVCEIIRTKCDYLVILLGNYIFENSSKTAYLVCQLITSFT